MTSAIFFTCLLGIAGLSVQGYFYTTRRMNEKFDHLDEGNYNLKEWLTQITGKVDGLEKEVNELKKLVNGLGEKIVQLGEQVAYIEGRLDTERNPGARSSSVNDDANSDKEGA